MTPTTTLTPVHPTGRGTPAAPRGRLRTLRLAVGYAAVAGTLPYLTLKGLWLSGNPVGVLDPTFLPQVELPNVITAGLDVVGILVALALTHAWGRRIPAWMVIAPMWIATGLLTPIAISTPIGALAGALSGAAPGAGADPLDSWVRPIVYGTFTWQGITLVTAFVLYALDRWGAVLTPVAGDALAPMARTLVRGASVPALLVAGFWTAWTFGATVGLPPAAAAARGFVNQFGYGVYAACALAAVLGALALTERWAGRVPVWTAVSAVWTGTGVMVAWALYRLANALGQTVFGGGGTPVGRLLDLAQLLGGLVLGTAALTVLAGRVAGARGPATGR